MHHPATAVHSHNESENRDASKLAAQSQLRIAAALLPMAYVIHLVEEVFGGLPAWAIDVLGRGIPADRFIAINATAFVLFVAGTIGYLRFGRARWFPTALATILTANGVLHALAALYFGGYAPGVITGLVLYLPLGAIILRGARRSLTPALFKRAVVAGLLFHGLVSAVAFA